MQTTWINLKNMLSEKTLDKKYMIYDSIQRVLEQAVEVIVKKKSE